jgi:thymidylate kinase
MNSRGLLVAFEGIDATGKSTLAPRVSKLLQSQYNLKSVFIEEFPADYLSGYLSDLMAVDPLLRLHDSKPTPVTQTLVLIGAHVYKYETQLADALTSNQVVCVERYTASILAYQPVFLAMETSRTRAELEEWISSVLSLVPPADINILLTAEPEIIAARIRARDEWDEENMKLLEVILDRYRNLAASTDWATFDSGNDGPEETSKRIAAFISERLANRNSVLHGNC